nr:hypothetical protein [Tanacetum cinerariifolium]
MYTEGGGAGDKAGGTGRQGWRLTRRWGWRSTGWGGGAGTRPWWAGRDAPFVPEPWAGPAGRRGQRVVRRPHVDEGVARLVRVWCRGARGGSRRVRVVGWGGSAGDEAGGRADSWWPAVVGRQGGEAGRLGRGWRGGGHRRVGVVGPAKRHRRGGRAGRRGRPYTWWADGDAALVGVGPTRVGIGGTGGGKGVGGGRAGARASVVRPRARPALHVVGGWGWGQHEVTVRSGRSGHLCVAMGVAVMVSGGGGRPWRRGWGRLCRCGRSGGLSWGVRSVVADRR